jgi:glutaredoxin
MRAAIAAWVVMGVAAASVAAAQQLYRWVDKDGRVHYTQQPPPKGAAKSVEQRKIGPSVVETSRPSFVLKQAMTKFPVTLFVAPNCKEGCPETRDLLAKRGVPFREVNVVDQPTSEALKKATGDNKVPALLVGTQVQVGYNPDAMQRALDSAGYPASPAFVGKPPELPPLPELAQKPPPEAAEVQAAGDKPEDGQPR